jgi:hypothetical protein
MKAQNPSLSANQSPDHTSLPAAVPVAVDALAPLLMLDLGVLGRPEPLLLLLLLRTLPRLLKLRLRLGLRVRVRL